MLVDMLSGHTNSSIRFVNVKDFVDGRTFYIGDTENFSEEAYYRLLIPEIMQAYEKVL